MATDAALYPVFKVRGKVGVPSHTAFNFYATSDVRWTEAKKQKGVKELRRYILDQNVSSMLDNMETDNIVERRNRAISLDYKLTPQDEYNSITSWETVPTTNEKQQLQIQIDRYEQLLAEAIVDGGADPSDEQKQIIFDYRQNIAQLKRVENISYTGSMGFIDTGPSVFGYGGQSLYDTNNVPNIDKVRRSTFALDADRPFHMAFRFAYPLIEQRETSFRMGWDRYLLEFRGGRSALFSVYSRDYLKKDGTMDYTRIQRDENRLNQYLDKGRLTDVDMLYIEEREIKIRKIKLQIKKDKIESDSDQGKALRREIEQLEDEIDVRRQSKRRMPGDASQQADILQKKLYDIYEQSINLQESAENFYGDDGMLRLTFLPQRRGYLTITLTGADPVTIEIPEITETKKYQPLWGRSRILLESNGGAFSWQFMYPDISSRGEFRLRNVYLPFEIDPEQLIFLSGDWETTGRVVVDDEGEEYYMSPFPGAGICFKVEESENFVSWMPRYDFVAKLRSDIGKDEDSQNTRDIKNAYLPWLYSLNFFVPPGDLDMDETVLWDSEAFGELYTIFGNFNPNMDNPIMDISVSYDDIESTRRGSSFTIDIADPEGTANFLGYVEHWCDFLCGLWTPEDGKQGIVPYYMNCVIKNAELVNVSDVGQHAYTDDEIYEMETFWRLQVHDLWAVIDEATMPCDVILDGMSCGAAVRLLAMTAGVPDSMFSGIADSGLLSGQIIPRAEAGARPYKVAERGYKVGRIMTEIVEEYGMTDDYQELRLRILPGGLSLDVPSDTAVAIHAGGGVAGCNTIRSGAVVSEDWSRFFNVFTVEGRKSRRTGETLRAHYSIPQSWLPQYESHPLHLGYIKEHPVERRSELDEQADVEKAVTVLALKNARSGRFVNYEVSWLYPPAYIGDTIEADGTNRTLSRLSGMSMRGITSASISLREKIELPN